VVSSATKGTREDAKEEERMPVRPASLKDLPAIASIHKAQFPTHFLGQYSPRLLEGLYRGFLGKSLLLVHEAANGVDGFILGGESERLGAVKAEFVREHLLRCLWETLLRPHMWWQGFKRGIAALTVVPPKRDVKQQDQPASPTYRLLSIAVADGAVGKGVAKELVQAFELTIRQDIKFYGLSVNKDNARAIRFYEKMGFHRIKDDGDTLEYKRDLDQINQEIRNRSPEH
jgi:ribosomal protein S18 acetylase RimI-like enzyme